MTPAAPPIALHQHDFPNGNKHRHSHAIFDSHPRPINEAHPQSYYFLCVDCEPDRARLATARSTERISEEWR